MTVSTTGASSASAKWLSIDWKAAEQHVRRLQMRIAKAIREGRTGKAKALQWILTHSFYAKALAVRKVSRNKGSKTPGIDGVVWNSDAKKMKATLSIRRRGYRPSPLRRVLIPKKNGKTRPLGIPCAIDRGHQALHQMALEPISETRADPNAYGFRPRRSVADAIEQCFKVLAKQKSPQWVLEGDIRACFDGISHQWLVDNIPMDKITLGKWLKSGYMEKGVFYRTDSGTPQGGIISPTLCVMTLQGLEQAVKQSVRARGDMVNCIVYADDFIITGVSKEVLVNKLCTRH